MPDLDDWITQYIDGAFMAALHKAIDATVTGNGTGEPRGFLAATRISVPYPLSDAEMADHGIMPIAPEPTPAERAIAILEPHLGSVALYRPPYPRGGVLPSGFGATFDKPPALRGPNWKARP